MEQNAARIREELGEGHECDQKNILHEISMKIEKK